MTQSLEEAHYRLFRLIEAKPNLTQRDLAREMGVSLGKVNYCMKALIDKGLVKARNFRRSGNKAGYAYLLTPRGIEEKAAATVRFLQRKVAEYELLQREIADLRLEVGIDAETGEVPPPVHRGLFKSEQG